MHRSQPSHGTFWQNLLHPLRALLGGPREQEKTAEDTDAADSEQIVFRTLDPVASRNRSLDSFGHLTEAWIKQEGDALSFDQAHWYTKNHQIDLLEAGPLKIVALTQGRSTYRQEIQLQEGAINASCTCRPSHSVANPEAGKKRCRHILAALLAYAELQGPQPTAIADDCLCPITRKPVNQSRTVYQCSQCQTAYSPEGWEFLQQTDKGRCCTCHQRKTIALLR